MKLKVLAASLALAMGAGGALAADQSVSFVDNVAQFLGTDTLLSGGSDMISFTGLAAGGYTFTLSVESQHLTLSHVTLFTTTPSGGVSGAVATIVPLGATITFAGTVANGLTPVWVTLQGLATHDLAGYSGTLTASPLPAIPEPGSFAMLLAGLGAVGFVARRRKT